jgi:hypothetical protein
VHPYEHRVLRLRVAGHALGALLRKSRVPLYTSGLRGGVPAPGRSYTVAANELLATGAAYPALSRAARGAARAGTDLEALERYIEEAGFG